MIDNYELQIRELADLMRSPGWKQFTDMLEGVALAAHTKLVNTTDPHMLVRAQATYQAVKDLASWPQRQGEGLKQMLNQSGAV